MAKQIEIVHVTGRCGELYFRVPEWLGYERLKEALYLHFGDNISIARIMDLEEESLVSMIDQIKDIC